MTKVSVRRGEAARMLSICLTSFDELVAAGAIKVVRFGRAVIVPVSELEEFLEREKAAAAPKPEAAA